MLCEASDERLPLSARFEYHYILRHHQLVIRVKKSRAFVFVHRRNCICNNQHGPSLDYLAAAVQRERELLLLLNDCVQPVLHPILHPALHRCRHQKEEVRQTGNFLIYSTLNMRLTD